MEHSEAKRLEPLDALRGIAAIGVAVFWHYQHFQPGSYPFEDVFSWLYHYGYLGVNFFFVLSGFVFSYVYAEKIMAKAIDVKTFIILRLSRLYPVFFVTTFVVALIQLIRKIEGHGYFVYQYNDMYHFILNIFFLHAGWFEKGLSFNAPSWSIAMECLAYLLFFGALYCAPKKRFLTFFLFILAGLFIQIKQMNVPLLNQGTSQVLTAFFTGCFTYKIHCCMQRKMSRYVSVSFVSFFFLSIITVGIGREYSGEAIRDACVFMLFPSLILIALNFNLVKKVTSLRPLTYLGDISYSVYLWHFPVQLVLITLHEFAKIPFDPSQKKYFISYCILVFLVGSISYRYETIIRRRIRKLFLNA